MAKRGRKSKKERAIIEERKRQAEIERGRLRDLSANNGLGDENWIEKSMMRMWEKGEVVDMIAGGDRVDKEVEIIIYEESYRRVNNERPQPKREESIKSKVKV